MQVRKQKFDRAIRKLLKAAPLKREQITSKKSKRKKTSTNSR